MDPPGVSEPPRGGWGGRKDLLAELDSGGGAGRNELDPGRVSEVGRVGALQFAVASECESQGRHHRAIGAARFEAIPVSDLARAGRRGGRRSKQLCRGIPRGQGRSVERRKVERRARRRSRCAWEAMPTAASRKRGGRMALNFSGISTCESLYSPSMRVKESFKTRPAVRSSGRASGSASLGTRLCSTSAERHPTEAITARMRGRLAGRRAQWHPPCPSRLDLSPTDPATAPFENENHEQPGDVDVLQNARTVSRDGVQKARTDTE